MFNKLLWVWGILLPHIFIKTTSQHCNHSHTKHYQALTSLPYWGNDESIRSTSKEAICRLILVFSQRLTLHTGLVWAFSVILQPQWSWGVEEVQTCQENNVASLNLLTVMLSGWKKTLILFIFIYFVVVEMCPALQGCKNQPIGTLKKMWNYLISVVTVENTEFKDNVLSDYLRLRNSCWFFF